MSIPLVAVPVLHWCEWVLSGLAAAPRALLGLALPLRAKVSCPSHDLLGREEMQLWIFVSSGESSGELSAILGERGVMSVWQWLRREPLPKRDVMPPRWNQGVDVRRVEIVFQPIYMCDA